jgi:conjugal transfer pilus assembly protein TraE
MAITKLKNSIMGTRTENSFLKKALAGMVLINACLAVAAVSRDTVVSIIPPTMTERGWLDANAASDSYTEAWALYIASVVGNVTPSNAGMIRTSLEPILDESIYQEVINAIESQVSKIRQDRVTLKFEAKQVLREKNNPNKFFVVGRSIMTGPTGRPERQNVTYEVELQIKNYRPVVKYLSTYSGGPKTEDVIRREDKSSKAKSRMEKANESK